MKIPNCWPLHEKILQNTKQLVIIPVSALISITHRLSGMYVFFITLPLMLALIYFSTESEDSFNDLSLFLKDYKFILGLIVLSFCILWYHILSGVRHLIMDAHIGESLIASKYSAIFTISLWIITTSFVFWKIFSWRDQQFGIFKGPVH